uniref:HECT domain-containing protein n=1 Tax=Heterorhabditis bacteriophora TaxID=37862 RepID=A0A1I7WWE2_HETBA
MQVRSFSNLDVTYSVIVRDNTAMLPTAETADRVIMLIEPFHKDKKITEDDVVKVREISEAQPEIRLHRLISRNQLDEAEKFAHQFKLDLQVFLHYKTIEGCEILIFPLWGSKICLSVLFKLQKVNIARMNFLLSKVSLDDSQDVFSQLMKCFDAVNDHNLVGETCFAGATTFGQYDRIIALLSYAKKRAITDVDTIERLSRLSYVLATYRLMMGPENANYGPDSLWENFVEGAQGEGEWPNLFRDMLSEGLIKEARVLWNRHNSYIAPEYSYIAPNSIEEESTMQSLSNLFSILNSAISSLLQIVVIINNLSIWRDVIGLLEFDVVPMCLSGTAKQMCPLLVDFLLSLARRLELLDSSNFPLNALHTTSTFDRILDRLVKDTITSSKQSFFSKFQFYFHNKQAVQSSKYFPSCTEGHFAVNVVGCPGSTHECLYKIVIDNPFFVTSNNFPQKVLLALIGKQRDANVESAANAVFGEFIWYPFSELANFPHLMQSSRDCCFINS